MVPHIINPGLDKIFADPAKTLDYAVVAARKRSGPGLINKTKKMIKCRKKRCNKANWTPVHGWHLNPENVLLCSDF